MKREKFEKLLTQRGYKPSDNLEVLNKPEYSIWENPHSNILIEVRNVTFARVIKFNSGEFGYIESLRFDQNNCI